MAQEDVGHVPRIHAELGQRVEDQTPRRNHAGVGHDQGATVADERDGAPDSTAIADVAGVEQVDAGAHSGILARGGPLRP